MDARQYIAWAGRLLNEGSRFSHLRDAFPELVPGAKKFDDAFATIHMGAAVIFAFKTADGMNYADIHWHLKQLLNLLPKPGSVSALNYTGMLVLVFKKPLDPAKRDALIGMRARRFLRRCFAQVVIVELDAGALWTSKVPRVIRPLMRYLSEALGGKGDPAPLPASPPLAGQVDRRTELAIGTMLLVTVLCAVHLLLELAPGEYSFDLKLIRFGSDHPALVGEGEKWRMVTAIFLHAGWGHLIGNLVGIFHWGRGIEPLFGTGWLFAIFLVTGFFGEVLTNLFSGASMSVGASGAAFGLCGALTAIYIFRKSYVTLRSRGQMFFWAVLVGTYLIWNATRNPHVNNFAHFGGFFAGFVMGSFLPFKSGGRAQKRGGWWGLASAAVALWAALGAWGQAPQKYRDIRDNPLRVAYEEPAGWYKYEVREKGDIGAGVQYFNGAGASFSIVQYGERLDWMLVPNLGREEALNLLYSRTSKNLVGKTLERVEDVWVGGGKAVKVFYVETFQGQVFGAGTDCFIPHITGYLQVNSRWPSEDSGYYAPVFSRLESTLLSLETPVEPKPVVAQP